MHYVTCMGELYQLTNKQYKRMLELVVVNGNWQEYLELNSKRLAGSILSVTDLTAQQAEDELQRLAENEKWLKRLKEHISD